jgi:hypothetical protein
MIERTEVPYSIGQTVRWGPELTRDWHDTRAADGVATVEGAQVGRVTAVYTDSGYCGCCEYEDRDCPGPWYTVDFGRGDSTGFGGLYAGHELALA